MADDRGHARTSAQELVERLLAEQRAKAAACRAREHGGEQGCGDAPHQAGERGRGEAVRAGDRVYEDEPIIKTGAQFVRDRQRREERDARSKAAYVRQASSQEDASWRELMAYGTIHHAKGASPEEGCFGSSEGPGAPVASGNSAASSVPSVTQNCSQMAQNRRYWPNGATNGEDNLHSFRQDRHSFTARSNACLERVNIDDFVPKPGAAPCHTGNVPSRDGIALRDTGAASRHAGGGAHAADVPEWRRPAREASLAGFSLEDESGRSFGSGVEPPEPVELPPLLQELRSLEREDAAFLKSRDWLFVRQAKLAADYEDDFVFEGTFQHYFPTYQTMDDRQLRGYFAWRTKARRGRLERTSLSFAFVHLYELLNGVGASTPEAGFEALRSFVCAYRALDSRIDRYARMWLHDYVVYHGLNRSLLEEAGETTGSHAGSERSLDEALAVLVAAEGDGARNRQALGGENAAPDTSSDERLFTALCALSSYHLDTSRFCREEPELTRRAACETWRALGAYYRAHRKRSFFESLFGNRFEVPYPMFRSAVFYGETRHADAVYEVNPVRRFTCRNGRWSEEAYHEAKGCSKDLGRVMKALDRTLRQACGSKHQLKAERVPKYVQDILKRVVERVLEERRQAEERARAVRVEIDFSKLQGIRAAAATTRESLLIDEEREDSGEGDSFAPVAGAPSPHAEASSPEAAQSGAAAGPGLERAPGAAISQLEREGVGEEAPPSPPPTSANAAGLTADEVAYLRCLADGAPAEERAVVLKRAGIIESLMVDAVNEKLYDLVGDIVIEDAGEGPALVEDYVDDVKGYAGL